MRTKKTTTKKQTKLERLVPEQRIIKCSICGKEFVADDVAKYIIAGGRTCSWNCFYGEVKRRDATMETKKVETKKKK